MSNFLKLRTLRAFRLLTSHFFPEFNREAQPRPHLKNGRFHVTPPVILYFFKGQNRLKIEYSSHIRSGVRSQSSHFSLDRLQKHPHVLLGALIIFDPTAPFPQIETSQASRCPITNSMETFQMIYIR